MSSVEARVSIDLSSDARRLLLDLARASIERGLNGELLKLNLHDYPGALRQPAATFVTLHIGGELHGCIGSLEANRPLVRDIAENACAAAFHDPRFPRLTYSELARLVIHISILTPPEVLRFVSEDDLLRQLRPGVDGLILTERSRRGTFLPAVWQTLPDPRAFLRALKHKAGLEPDYWSATVMVERYTAESIP